MSRTPLPEVSQDEPVRDSGSPVGLQEATRDLAEQGNMFTQIGSTAAQAAHVQLATMQGTLAGQNPGGRWDTAREMFDPDFAKTYETQAAATLGLHANKLLLDSNIALSKDPNLTYEKIAAAHAQVAQGMQQIFSQAPEAVKGQLETQYADQLQSQSAQFQKKMIEQQNDDQRQTGLAFLNQQNKTIFNLAMSGASKDTIQKAIDISQETTNTMVRNRQMNLVDQQIQMDTLRQTAVHGQYVAQGVAAYNNRTYPQFISDLASGKIAPEVKPADRPALISAVDSYVGQIKNSADQQQQIIMTKATEDLLINPVQAATNLPNIMSQLSPENAEKLQLAYIKYNAKHQASQPNMDAYGNAESFATLTDKQKDSTFFALTQAKLKSAQDSGNPIPQWQAETQVAIQAGGEIPVFKKILENKALNGTPQQMLEATQQIEYITGSEEGNKINLSDKARIASAVFRNSLSNKSLEDARTDAIKAVAPLAGEEDLALKDLWSQRLKQITTQGKLTPSQAGLSLAGSLGNSSWPMSNPNLYGQEILNRYHNYFSQSRGNDAVAKELLQQDIENSFGHTMVNNKPETSIYPVEKMMGLPPNSAPIIQDDIHAKLTEQLKNSKALYDAGKINTYFEVVPRLNTAQRIEANKQQAENAAKNMTYGQQLANLTRNVPVVGSLSQLVSHERPTDIPVAPIQVIQHFRNGQSEKYEVEIHPSPMFVQTVDSKKPYLGGWDIGIRKPSGLVPLAKEDPWDGFSTYEPDKSELTKQYLKYYPTITSNVIPSNYRGITAGGVFGVPQQMAEASK